MCQTAPETQDDKTGQWKGLDGSELNRRSHHFLQCLGFSADQSSEYHKNCNKSAVGVWGCSENNINPFGSSYLNMFLIKMNNGFPKMKGEKS